MHKPSHEMREGRGGEARAGSSLRRDWGSGRGYAVSLRWGEEVRGHSASCRASVSVDAGCVCPALGGRRRKGRG